MKKTTLGPSSLCETGDTLYRLGCKNPYRAILTAASRGLDSQAIQRAYLASSEGQTLSESDQTLLTEFAAIVKESTDAIEALSPD
ncbi:MAG: hypothetical protein M3Z14_02710 [Candidatus Eremiobacteraeota bacterium]|nr:hypothetical protein [Candidatus Eremiobacteraeota bacterium]